MDVSEKPTNSLPQNSTPTCPKCGQPLQLTGKIVQVLNYKKWVNEWHCPTHGLIELEKKQ